MRANSQLRKSVESLSPRTMTASQVCDILKSQAELNKVNVVWNSVTSMSLLLDKQKINSLEATVDEQSTRIEGLFRGLAVHQMVIDRLLQGFYSLAIKYESMLKRQNKSYVLLNVVKREVELLRYRALSDTSSLSSRLSRFFSHLSSMGIRFGILYVICDAIVRLSQILNVTETIFTVFLSRPQAQRAQFVTRMASVSALVLILRDKFSLLIALLRRLLSQS